MSKKRLTVRVHLLDQFFEDLLVEGLAHEAEDVRHHVARYAPGLLAVEGLERLAEHWKQNRQPDMSLEGRRTGHFKNTARTHSPRRFLSEGWRRAFATNLETAGRTPWTLFTAGMARHGLCWWNSCVHRTVEMAPTDRPFAKKLAKNWGNDVLQDTCCWRWRNGPRRQTTQLTRPRTHRRFVLAAAHPATRQSALTPKYCVCVESTLLGRG